MEKNLFPTHTKFTQRIMLIVCKLIGHQWSYKNYEMTLKDNGDVQDYKYSRRCHRCNNREVFRSDSEGWQPSETSSRPTL